MNAHKVGEGAYFAPSYSEQTIIPFQPAITAQTVITGEFEEETTKITAEIKDVFMKQDFEKALKRVSRRIKK